MYVVVASGGAVIRRGGVLRTALVGPKREGVQVVPFHLFVVHPFMATADPSVLGIKPIPKVDDKIKAMLDNILPKPSTSKT